MNQSPSLNKDAIAVEGATASELASDPDEVSKLRCRVAELEQQLEDAMEKLLVSEDSVVVQCEDREVGCKSRRIFIIITIDRLRSFGPAWSSWRRNLRPGRSSSDSGTRTDSGRTSSPRSWTR